MESITGYSYPADSVMFDKTLDTYSGLSPFSTYYMTISGHSNYVPGPLVDEGLALVNQYYGDRYKDTTKYYLCYQMELDRAMDLLIRKLEQAGIADNTVIASCPDHYPYGLEQSATFGNTEDYLADLYGYVYSNWMELDHSVEIRAAGHQKMILLSECQGLIIVGMMDMSRVHIQDLDTIQILRRSRSTALAIRMGLDQKSSVTTRHFTLGPKLCMIKVRTYHRAYYTKEGLSLETSND